MTYEVFKRFMDRMPPERREALLFAFPDVRQKWQMEAMQKILSQQLQAKFGLLPQKVVDSIQNIESEEALSNLAQKVITASSLGELGLS